MTRLPFLSVPRGVKISTLPIPDVSLLECTADVIVIAKAMIADAKRIPRNSSAVRGLRLIRGSNR